MVAHRLIVASLVLFCISCLGALRAQDASVLEGSVSDATSGEPIGGAVVRLAAPSRRTYTAASGRFRLPIPAGEHRVIVSSIGYHDTSVSVTIGRSPVRIDVRLVPSSIKLEGVEVTAGLTADQIIRRAIDRKNENRSKALTVQGLLYTKTSFAIEGNAFGQLGDHDRQGILETFSRAYYSEKGPRVIVIQRRQTANIPAESNLLALGDFVSFYNDDLTVLNARIPSPLNASTLGRYTFSLHDRKSLNGETVYVIGVEPATRLLPTFEGTVTIAANNYNLIEVDLRPSKSTAVSFVRDLRLRQKFEKLQDEIWQPTFLEITGKAHVEIVSGLAEIEATVSATSIFTELVVNAPIPDSIYRDDKVIAAAPTADSSRPEFWEGNSLSELSAQERATYHAVDSLMAIADTVEPRAGVLFSIDPYVSFNRAGSLTAGVSASPRFGPLRLDAMGAYSLGLRRPLGKVGLNVTLMPRTDSTLSLSVAGELFSEIATASADAGYPDIINSAVAALLHRDYNNHYRRDGWSAAAASAYGELGVRLEIEMARHFSIGTTTSRSIFVREPFRANPPVLEGSFRTLGGALTWGRTGVSVTISSSTETEFGAAVRGIYGEGAGRSFRAAEAEASLTFGTIPTGYAPMTMRIVAGAGAGSDNLPPQYQFRLGTSDAIVGKPNSLYSAPAGLYGGTRYASVTAEHNFSDIAWRALGLPLYEGRGLEFGLSGAAGWAENAGGSGYAPTGGQWYTEAGFSIGRIPIFVSNVIFLGFDSRWGLGPLGAGRWGGVVRLSSPF